MGAHQQRDDSESDEKVSSKLDMYLGITKASRALILPLYCEFYICPKKVSHLIHPMTLYVVQFDQ